MLELLISNFAVIAHPLVMCSQAPILRPAVIIIAVECVSEGVPIFSNLSSAGALLMSHMWQFVNRGVPLHILMCFCSAMEGSVAAPIPLRLFLRGRGEEKEGKNGNWEGKKKRRRGEGNHLGNR